MGPAPTQQVTKADRVEELPAKSTPPTTELDLMTVGEALPKESPVPVLRLALSVSLSTLAAAVMVGGVFIGVLRPRLWAGVAGLLGIALAIATNRLRRPLVMYITVVVGLFGIGLLLVLPTGIENLFGLGPVVRKAVTSGDVLRPPVPLTAGWLAIVGWMMGCLGFTATWTAKELRRPALAILMPLPIVAITAISVSEGSEVVSGIFAVILFGASLGVLSGLDLGGEGEHRLSLRFEIRRAVRGVIEIGAISVVLLLLVRFNLLFPAPRYDPTQEAQKPRTVPLSEVKDRVLFRVKSSITGPWRIGHLDVYDGKDWRLPPFAESRLKEVPRSGVVDSELIPGVKATFEIVGLGGAVLPGLPNTVGIVAEGPKLAFDRRMDNIRLAQGTVEPGLRYHVVAAALPTIQLLRQVDQPVPDDVKEFLDIPSPPPAVSDLLARAPTSSVWDKMDFMRQTLLKTVVANGQGVPVSVPPSKVQDMLAGSKEGTPFEIVAAQAMLARWAGVPSRIGYGFDGGEKVGDAVEVRPKHGASYLEVYFPTYKWLPVVGTPLQAKTSIGSDPQQFDPNVVASDEVAVKVYVPIALDPRAYLFQQIRRVVLIIAPLILFLLLIYYSWPAVKKAISRSRRRNWARRAGPSARIATAYAEWRDFATDFAYRYETDTPLMFLSRVIRDNEHTELAWLTTRTLWGDLQGKVTAEDAAVAEELSGSLRKRMSQALPWTLRAIAVVSRLSLRYPFAPGLGRIDLRKGEKKAA